MKTEYPGSRYRALLQEIRQRGWRPSAWRATYEVRKRLGLTDSYFRTDPIEPDELFGLFEPALDGPAALRSLLSARLNRSFLIAPDRREDYVRAIHEACPERLEPLRRTADELAEGRFEFMGKRFDFTDRDIDWSYEPESGRSWPHKLWTRFGLYDADAPGDVKFTWEPNRHQFWPTLGRAYWLTGDERYAEAWVRQITSWLDANPPEIGVNWRSNLEHALRIINWWIALAMFIPSRAVTDELLCRIVGTMVLKTRHILADLDYSRVNMCNNHLLGDAMGLATMGLVLPELREARRWRDVGLEVLWSQGPEQIHPDGSSFECAISYHRFVAYFYIVVCRLCERTGQAIPETIRQRLEGMFDFVMHLRRPDGGMPSVGDWDDGRAVVLSEQALDDFRPMLSTGAVLYRRGDLAWAAGRLDEETIWLLGPQAVDVFAGLDPTPPTQTSRAFPDGGYHISRSGWDADAHYALIRNEEFESHTHADLLNVELAANRQRLLVDPGTYTYNGPWSWRTYFRSARAHNALLVDGQGQTYAHRIFRWVFPPEARTLAWQSSERVDYFEGQVGGYRGVPGVTGHRRIVLAVRGEYWLILDGLLGRGDHELELPLHMPPEIHVESKTGRLRLSSKAGPIATVLTWGSHAPSVGTARGQEQPIDGWFSPGYGRKVPATSARLRASGPLPIWIAWLVLPHAGTAEEPELHVAGSTEQPHKAGTLMPLRLRIETGRASDMFLYNSAETPVRTYIAPGLELPVGAAWARLEREGGRAGAHWVRD